MKHRALSLLSATVLVTSLLPAQTNFLGVFRQARTSYASYYGLTPAQYNAQQVRLFPRGLRVLDHEVYRDANGNVRIDCQFLPFPGSQIVKLGLTRSQLITERNAQNRTGRRMTDISGYFDNQGNRVYAAVFLTGRAGRILLGRTWQDLVQWFQTWGSQGFRLNEIETYLDAQGVRRYDAIFEPGTWAVTLVRGLTRGQLVNRKSSERTAGKEIASVETYLDSAGTQRYLTIFRSGVPRTALVLERDFSQLVADLNFWTRNGYTLFDTERRVLGPRPSKTLYGTGLAGRRGVPDLDLTRAPGIGQDNTLILGNSSGAQTLASLVFGTRTDVPWVGGRLLVNPIVLVQVTLPSTGLRLPVRTPHDPTLNGVKLNLQLVQSDRATPAGLSLSRGLEIRYGFPE